MKRVSLRNKLLVVAAVALIVLGAAGQSQAAQITTLYSTGVDAFGTPLADGAIDPHYTVGGSAYAIGNPGSIGWIGNTASSSWISATPDTRAGGGPFIYHTTFDLTGFAAGTAIINGSMAADDQASIFLNGVDVFDGASTFSQPWSFFESFSINSGFVSGINTIDILVPNNIEGPDDGPTGVQVAFSGTARSTVPEPGTVTLVGFGIVALALAKRKLFA